MKFEQLHLKAFGAFDDRKLDFSGGNAGFHLVYGPNEAGKSTTLRAITQFLYGIETRTADDFLHPMKSLRIGATLSNGRETLACYRRKGNKGTLLAEDEKTHLPDDALAPFLAGVDEETFKNLFGLSHAQLVRGGGALVQGEGDVGQALFSAAAGIGNLKELLARLDGQAGDLFKPTGAKPRINAALREYRELRRAIKEAQLRPQAWEEPDQTLKAAKARRADLDAQIHGARAESARLERIQRGLPLVARRLALLAELAPHRGAVLLPEGFSERRHQCQTALFNAEANQTDAAKTLAALDEELARRSVNEAILAHDEAIESLNRRYASNQKAMRDLEGELLPHLRVLEGEAERALHHLRPNWTLDQVEELRLAPGQQQRINALSNRGEALKTHRGNAETALKKLRREHAAAAGALNGMGPAAVPAGVERALKRAGQAAEMEEAPAEQRRRAALMAQSLDAGVARLGPWTGTGDALESLPVPSGATIERFRLEHDGARKKLRDATARVAALETALQQAEAQWTVYQKAHDAPSLAALEALRRERQDGWGHARTAWEAGTPPREIQDADATAFLARVRESHPDVEDLADAYAALVEAADVAADRLRNEADRVAALAQLETDVATLQEELEKARASETALGAAAGAVEKEWIAVWAPADIAPLSPAEMAVWKQEHTELLQAVKALREAREAAEAQQATIEDHRARLLKALREAGVAEPREGDSLADCVALAEEWARQQRDAVHERARLEDQCAALAEAEIPEAEDALETAASDLETWEREWSAMAEALGASASASPGEVLALLEAIDALLAKAGEAEQLRERVKRIERDDAAFRAEVRAVADTLAPERASQPEAAIVQALYGELKLNREARKDRERLTVQRDQESARLRDAETALLRLNADLKALCAEAGVKAAEDLPAAEKASAERQRVETALRDTEAQLLALSPGLGMEEFLAQISAEDPDSVAPALTSLESAVAECDAARSAALIEIGTLNGQLAQMDGSDEAARLAGDAQALLSAIAADADEYARLKVATFALNKAIEAYRAANQEPLLARAGELFGQLTLGSFTGLLADYDDKGRHVLCGLRPGDGAPVHVDGMSEGTADQLYLALRLASLERHLEKHSPVPLVLDDILVNFDDVRAGATLGVLGDFSSRTQVIYFTHHRHLVELAKAHVGGERLFVHTLEEEGHPEKNH